jgi:hypothetical protein
MGGYTVNINNTSTSNGVMVDNVVWEDIGRVGRLCSGYLVGHNKMYVM